jgi:hypothetical protein
MDQLNEELTEHALETAEWAVLPLWRRCLTIPGARRRRGQRLSRRWDAHLRRLQAITRVFPRA